MQITPEKWIESNRKSLMVLAEFINIIPDPMIVHRQIPIGECVITAEAFDPNHHLTHPKLIVTQVFVVHAGRMSYRGEDCLVQIMFPTTAGLVAMYLNLTHYFWRLVTPGMAPYLESLATKISEANQLPLDEMGVFDSYIMTSRVMTTPPPHLMSMPLDKTVVMARELDGTVFGLEVARLTSTSNAYHVSTITVTQTSEVDKIMSVLADAQTCFNSRNREWALNQDAQDNNPCLKLYVITDSIQARLTATMGLVMYRVFVTQDSDNRGLKLSVSPMVTSALPMIESAIQGALEDLRTHDNLTCTTALTTLSNMVVVALRLDMPSMNARVTPATTVSNEVTTLLNSLGEQVDYANTYPLAMLGLFANFKWQSSVLDQLPPHLAHAEPGQMVLSIGRLNGVAAYLELAHVVDAHGVCNIRTIRADGVDGIGSMMATVSEACLEYSRLEVIRRQHAERPSPAKPSAPRPNQTIDVASLAIVKSIEECLQIDLGRATYTLETNLKAPLRRTMTVTAPKAKTLAAAADSVYSTCVKIAADRKHGCSVTVSRFARSVVVTITPTDRVIHI